MAGRSSNHQNRLVGADDLLGCEIVDLEGRPVGALHDIVIDIESGRIAHVFIAMNKPTYADQCVLAPWNALHVEAQTRRLRIQVRNGTQERGSPVPVERSNERFVND